MKYVGRDLKVPLLEKGEHDIENKGAKIHSAIPVVKPTRSADDAQANVFDGKCNLVNGAYFLGLLLGVSIQIFSLYAVDIATGDTSNSNTIDRSIPVVFFLYLFSRYWVVAALFLPPIITAVFQKLRRRRRNGQVGVKSNLEAFFQCIRFQLGMFFGCLILLSAFNFYSLAKTAPICVLLAYYAVCVVVSFLALCLLQMFVGQITANVSSIEIIVSYDDEEDDDDDNNQKK